MVEAAEQHYVLGRTLGQIAERFTIPYATLMENLKRLGKLIEPCLDRLKTDYRNSSVRHADETGWRTDGANGYSWYFGSGDSESAFVSRHQSGKRRARSAWHRAARRECWSFDRYGGYNRVPCRLPYCYAHLLREIKDVEAEFETNGEVKQYARQMKICLTDAMQLRKRELSEAEYVRQALHIKEQILKLSDYQARHPVIRKWQDFYVEKQERLYQWCESSQIPAENNYAEREIRKVVIAGKMSYGSQSEAGAKTREIWTSLLQSLKKRENHPRDKLIEVLNKLSENENLDITTHLFGSPKI